MHVAMFNLEQKRTHVGTMLTLVFLFLILE